MSELSDELRDRHTGGPDRTMNTFKAIDEFSNRRSKMRKYFLAPCLMLAFSFGYGQTTTTPTEWDCVSPRSGNVVSNSAGDIEHAMQACQDFANEQDKNFTLRGRNSATQGYDIQPTGSAPPPDPDPDPGPDPDPDPPPSGESLPAFTFQIKGGAKGTRGAHDCATSTVYHVTSLSNDRDQLGTLTNAVREDCRYIVFDVSGEIDMTDTMPGFTENGGPNSWLIVKKYLTIDGRTAPSPGITLTNVTRISLEYRGPPSITALVSNIIISNIRTVGRDPAGTLPNPVINHAHWLMDGDPYPVFNIALDHLTMVNSGQGNVNVYNHVRNITLQNSFSNGSLVGHHISGAGGFYLRNNISIYKHVYANHNERQVRLRYRTEEIDIVGNVIYGWGKYECGAHGLNFASSPEASSGNVEFNRYIFVDHQEPGSCARERDALVSDFPGDLPGPWYFANNIWPAGEDTGDAEATVASRVDLSGYELEPRELASRNDILTAGSHFKTAEEAALLREIADTAYPQ